MKRFKVGAGLLALLLAVLLSFSACGNGSPAAPPPGPPAPIVTEVVVVGGGLAGLAAAVSAAQGDVDVILVERMGITGGESRRSGGSISAAGSIIQGRQDITCDAADPTAWRAHFEMRSAQSYPRNSLFPTAAALDFLMLEAARFIEWMDDMGFQFGPLTGFARDPQPRLHSGAGAAFQGPAGLLNFFDAQARDAGVDIRINAKAVEILNENGPGSRVTGVRLENGTIIYAYAVIMATGGFAADLQRFMPWVDFPYHHTTLNVADGQGIQMTVDAGAELWADPWIKGIGPTPVSLIRNANENANIAIGGAGGPMVNADGDVLFLGDATTLAMYVRDDTGARFVLENHHYSITAGAVLQVNREGHNAFAIFDSALASPTTAQLATAGVYTGEDPAELAYNAGIDEAGLLAAVAQWNEIVAGTTADPLDYEGFGILGEPIETGPFFAVRLMPTAMGTFGGVRTNVTTGEVLAYGTNNPIPGLFAAGETASRPFYDKVYMAGVGLGQAGTTGRAAGTAAAAFVAAQD